MKSLSDADVVERYQAGDPAAGNEIVDRYWGLSALIAKEYPIPGVDAEDRHMEAMQGLLKAARGWRRGRGTAFKTFARLSMKRVLTDLYRRRHQLRELPADKKLSLDMELGRGDAVDTLQETVADPKDAFEAVERRAYAEAAAQHVLKAHAKVMVRIAQGYDQQEIAAELGVPAELVSGVTRFGRAVGAAFEARMAADPLRVPPRSAPVTKAEIFAALVDRTRKPNPTAVAWNYTRNLVTSDGDTLTYAEVAAIVAHHFPASWLLTEKAVAKHYAATGKIPRLDG